MSRLIYQCDITAKVRNSGLHSLHYKCPGFFVWRLSSPSIPGIQKETSSKIDEKDYFYTIGDHERESNDIEVGPLLHSHCTLSPCHLWLCLLVSRNM